MAHGGGAPIGGLWLRLLPELARLPPAERGQALHRARQEGFDAIELVALAATVAVAAVITQYPAEGLSAPSRMLALAWNFVLALPLLLAAYLPLERRRLRRGLRVQPGRRDA